MALIGAVAVAMLPRKKLESTNAFDAELSTQPS
jgi:hypothetical protein